MTDNVPSREDFIRVVSQRLAAKTGVPAWCYETLAMKLHDALMTLDDVELTVKGSLPTPLHVVELNITLSNEERKDHD